MSSLNAVSVGGEVNGLLWDAQVSAGDPVGVCACGGRLLGRPVVRRGRLRWFESECAACGREVVAPNGRLAGRQPVAA